MIPTRKYDEDQSYFAKCFPARPPLQWRKEDSGHWLDSFRKATERMHRHTRGRINKTFGKRENNTRTHSPCGKTLDASLLLRLRCTDQPAHLSSVDISEQNLNSVNPEDLCLFDNLLYVDASANSLSLDSFSRLVSLRELNLTLNGLCNMSFIADDFPHLQVLDLSYNSLSADGITSVGGIPQLKVLHLTGNQLRRLPPDLGFPHNDASRQENTSFRALEVLLLDDNKLSSEAFHSLKNLKRLKYLNLQGNCISKVPDFPLMGSLTRLQAVVGEQREDDGLASAESNAADTETILQQQWEEYRDRSWLPLPNLQYLCLADNKIAEEEALMAVTLFPRIREIDICSNPLTVQKSGDPPLLTHYLQHVLGINIKRKKTLPAVKGTAGESAHLRSKGDGTKGQIPQVAEKVALSQLPGPVRAEKCNLTTKSTLTEETVEENAELFFLTQAITDAPEFESSLQTAAENKETRKDVSTKPAHYETLTDVKSESDLTVNAGIQTAVWRLERALRNPKVLRDSRPHVDCVQASRREQQRKQVKERAAPTAVKQVDEIMKAVRQGTTTTDVLLSGAVRGSGVNRQEALQLLRDLRAKYKTLQQEMMGQVAGS